MKKYLLALLISIFCTVAIASDYVITDGLTEKQKAELTLKVAELKEAKTSSGPESISKAVAVNDAATEGIRKWGNVSTEIAKGLVIGLAAAAKEANVAVNDFAVTPIGRITTYIIVWKMIGRDFFNIIFGLSLLLIACPTIWYVYRRMISKNVTYEYKPFLWGAFERKRILSQSRCDSDPYVFLTVAFFVSEILTIITAISIIGR